MMRIDALPAILTCYAYRREYFAEMDGLLATIKEHHPNWPLVVARGPVPGLDRAAVEVESPLGKTIWMLPVPLELEGSYDDFRRIMFIKGWWLAQVWREFACLVAGGRQRLVWSDADARFNGPLDIDLDPESETIAGPWWADPENLGQDSICGGLLLFQGAEGGVVETILNAWSDKCLSCIEDPSKSESDQALLMELLQPQATSNSNYVLTKLEYRKYVGCPAKDGKIARRSLIDHWYMNEKMGCPEDHGRDWPPTEEFRRNASIGTPLPGWVPED